VQVQSHTEEGKKIKTEIPEQLHMGLNSYKNLIPYGVTKYMHPLIKNDSHYVFGTNFVIFVQFNLKY